MDRSHGYGKPTLIEQNEQLRQRVQELEKECDKELARNRPLRNLIASLEEQKSHWNKQRNEYREAVSTMDSERSANAMLTAERDRLSELCDKWNFECDEMREDNERLANVANALKQQRDELLAAAVMAVEMIEYEKHERRHVRWKLNDAIASVKEKA